MDVIAATKLADFLTPKGRGVRVNTHVVRLPSEPKPDFDAMKKVLEGEPVQPAGGSGDKSKREVSKDD
jgi:hypothetical protein